MSVNNSALTATIVLGILSLAHNSSLSSENISFDWLWLPVPDWLWRLMPYWPWLLVSIVIVGAFLFSIHVSIRNLSPRAYALNFLQGESRASSLQVLSTEIHKVCRGFLLEAADSHKFLMALHSNKINRSKTRQQTTDEIERIVKEHAESELNLFKSHKRLESWCLNHGTIFLRQIEELKKLAATNMHMNTQMLCDHIVQFSPQVMSIRIEKYVSNYQEIIDLCQLLSDNTPHREQGNSLGRLEAIIAQNIWIYEKVRNRLNIQNRLMKFSDMHNIICAISSANSTSEALQLYAKALSQATLLPDKDIGECLDFLYRKHMAHPGFELHGSLIKLCNSLEQDDLADALCVIENSTAPHNTENYRSLRRLGTLARDISFKFRDEVCTRLQRDIIEPWFEGNFGIAIGCGYSKLVREAFKKNLATNTNITKLIMSPMPLDIASRVLVDEIREDENYKERDDISICEYDVLPNILEKNTRVLILIGAEACDREHRITIPKGMRKLIKKLCREITSNEGHYLLVVLAESYKLRDRTFLDALKTRTSERSQSTQNTIEPYEHIDPCAEQLETQKLFQLYDLDILESGLVDVVVTEKGISTSPRDETDTVHKMPAHNASETEEPLSKTFREVLKRD